MTEKDKKDYYRKRIERDLQGNPNIKPFAKTRKLRFKAPTKEQEEKMKRLDAYGNPKPGYKWWGLQVVTDFEYMLRLEAQANQYKQDELIGGLLHLQNHKSVEGDEIQFITAQGIKISSKKLVVDPNGYLIDSKGNTFKLKTHGTSRRSELGRKHKSVKKGTGKTKRAS